MKKIALCLVVALAAIMFTSCASYVPAGSFYTELKLPVAVGEATAKPSKKGTASCRSILGLLATGDASISSACASADITTIRYIDWEAKNILGIIGDYTLVVYGD